MALQLHQGGKVDPETRELPHDIPAEEAVIAACVLAKGARDRVRGLGLKPVHFYSPECQRIWEAVDTLAEAPDDTVDLVTVHRWLDARGWLAKAGGRKYIEHVVDASPALGNVVAHTRILLGLARLRAVIAEANLLAVEGRMSDVGDLNAWLESAPQRVARAAEVAKLSSMSRIGDTLKESWAALTAQPGVRGGYPTGLEGFDARTGGLFPGEVMLLSAKEKAGKSTLWGQWAGHICTTTRTIIGPDGEPITRKRGVAVFALEGKKTDWGERLAAAKARIDLGAFRRGGATDDDRQRFARASDDVSRYAFFIDREHVATVGQMGARVRAAREELDAEGTDLVAVAIDYIQLAAGEGKNREEQVNSCMRGVVNLAGQKDLGGISWTVLSQLNKEGDLRESGALAQHCDGWINLTVEREKEREDSWQDHDGRYLRAPICPARLDLKLSRRDEAGAGANPIPLWACYRFNTFWDGRTDD